MHTKAEMISDLALLGIKKGDTVMVHSSYKSLGGIEGGAKAVFEAFFDVLGESGTLILPAFSFDTVGYDNPVFDIEKTPVCVGYLPEYFRTEVKGVKRSLHATHSVCAKGAKADWLIMNHELDLTPVGKNSPIAKLPRINGKILFLGCDPDHNTALHGVEETAEPPYLLNREKPIEYTLINGGKIIKQTALHHNFNLNGYHYAQRYSRIIDLLNESECKKGRVLDADCVLMDAKAVWEKGHNKLLENPFYFVLPVKI